MARRSDQRRAAAFALYQADVTDRPLEATLERDRANLANAKSMAARQQDLLQRGIATREQAETSRTAADALEATVASAVKAQLPPVSVTPAQGKLLHLIARALGAQRILEIGTLAGYSTIWLARALPPGGHLITIEANPTHADIARANIEGARVSDRVDIRVGKALDVLPHIAAERQPPFDFVFIDANNDGLLQPNEQSTLTGVDGVYTLDGVAAGTQNVAILVQPGNRLVSPPPSSISAISSRVNSIG